MNEGTFLRRPPVETKTMYKEPHSELLRQTYEMAKKHDSGEIDTNTFEAYLKNQYRSHDLESYDCHTFILSILKREFGLPVTIAPDFERPDRTDYDYETDFMEDMHAEVKKIRSSTEGIRFTEQQKLFTEKIYTQSEHLSIPKINPLDLKKSVVFEQFHAAVKKTTEEVVRMFKSGTKSSVILISAGDDKRKFIDLHSTIVLGVDNSGWDLLVLEKDQVGGSVAVRKFSDIILIYGLASSRWVDDSGKLEVNICNRPIGDVYQAALKS